MTRLVHHHIADITLDFETYWDKDNKYTLKSMTYEEYIRDPRFEIILCSFNIHSTGEQYYVTGENEVWKELNRLELGKQRVVAHNMAFDGMIITDLLDFTPLDYYCTMIMAGRVEPGGTSVALANLAQLHQLRNKGTEVEKASGLRLKDFSASQLRAYGEYSIGDVDITRGLYGIYRNKFSEQDMDTMSTTLRMHCDPFFQLDKELLREYIPQLAEARLNRMAAYAKKYNVSIDTMRTMFRSAKTFAPMLEELGIEPPMKPSKSNPKLLTHAFAKNDPDFKDLLDHPDPAVVDLVETKIGVGSSQAETRAQRFLDISSRGPLPMSLKPWGAHTGRDAAYQKINVQNLPSRGADKTLKRSMQAPEGHVVGNSDLSQVEARRLAAIAKQYDLLQLFAEGKDPYSNFASELYGYEVSKATPTERSVGKECILSLGFGAGAKSFQRRLHGQYGIVLDLEFADAAVKLYRRKNNKIKAFWNDCDEAVRTIVFGGKYYFGDNDEFCAEKGRVTLADGFVLRYDDARQVGEDDYGRPQFLYVDREKRRVKNLYSGLLCNNVTQASAGRILQWQAYNMRHESGLIMRNKVHDALIVLPKIEELEYYKDEMEYHMRRSPDWAQNTPLDCEFECGWNYADMMPYEDFIKLQELRNA